VLHNQSLNATVRASKKGEVLLMRKLGKLGPRPVEDPQDAATTPDAADQGLAKKIFSGPVNKEDFDTLRDLFSTARALSDADYMAVAGLAGHANNTSGVN
jgi:hypothetical protein